MRPWFRPSRDAWFVTLDGRQHRLDACTEADAITALASLLARLRGPVDRTDGPTVAEAVVGFLAAKEREGRAPATLAAYRTRLRRLGTLADRRAAGVTPAECDAWLDTFDETPVSRGERGLTLKWALARVTPDDAPCRRWKVPRPKSPRRSVPDRAGVDRWRAELRSAALRDVFDFLFATGARQDEARRLTAADLDHAGRCVRLGQHKTARKGRDRVVPVPCDRVWARLVELARLRPTGPLYVNARGEPWITSTLSSALGKAARRAGLESISGHCIRHLCACEMLNAGVSPLDAAGVLGHTVQMLMSTYAHATANPARLVAAARRRLS
jgi:integrase